jgi:hypothetical protein
MLEGGKLKRKTSRGGVHHEVVLFPFQKGDSRKSSARR